MDPDPRRRGRLACLAPWLRLAPWLCLGLSPGGAHAALSLADEDFRVGGYVDGGRFQISDTGRTGEIVNRVGARWHFDKSLGESWSTGVDILWYFWRNQATDLGLFHIAGQKFNSDMQGWLQYQAGPQAVKFGFFDFKYNPDSKDLGEYLIRSEAYPTLLESAQGKDLMAWSNTRVAGVQYGFGGEYLRHMALLYAEQVNEPVNDISAAYFLSAGPPSAEVSVGADYARFLRLGDSIHLTNDLQTVRNAQYVAANGLTTRAWKFILRGRLDLAARLGLQSPFVLYGEAALLGLKKDTLYYRNVRERMPMMAGVDIPTFGVLDVLSLEAEYFPDRYYEKKYQLQENKFTPLPSFVHDEEYSGANLPLIQNHDWRWSLAAERSLNKWLKLKLRLANDHMRLLNWSGDYEGGTPFVNKSTDWSQLADFRIPKDWYWMARIEFHD